MTKLKMLSMLTVMIASLFIFSSQALAVQYFTVSTSSGAPVNMRSGPGTNYPIMLSIPSGSVFLIIVTLMERLLQGSMERVISGTKSSGKIPGCREYWICV